MGAHDELLGSLGLDVDLHRRLMAHEAEHYREVILAQPNRPAAMAWFDRAVAQVHGARVQEIVDARADGAKMIGTFCIYVPEEIVLALGAIPFALCGGTAFSVPDAERVFPRDICPLIKSTLGLAYSKTCPFGPIKDMAVGETTCDAKKKTWDVLADSVNFHVLELPQKKSDRDRELWRAEVREFAVRMEELTGRRLTAGRLGEGIRLMNRKRRLLQRVDERRRRPRPPISGKDALVLAQLALVEEPRRFCDRLDELLEELRQRVDGGVSPFAAGAPRIMVAGCPSAMGNYKVHHIMESSGGVVVCDESCTGARYFRDLVDEDADGLDAMLDAVADRYFRIDCSCFSPNTERVDRIVEMARACGADAVVQYVLQYCHTYNVEAIRVGRALDRAGIPWLTIETDYSREDAGQLRTRVGALLESIQGGVTHVG